MDLRRTVLLAISAALITFQANASEIRIQSMESKALGRQFNFAVYTPDGYGASNLKYPVVYLLHGGNNDESSWTTKGKIQQILDRLIEAKEIPPIIAVMPGNYRSYWMDGKEQKAETAVVDDLIPYVDSTFRTIPERKGRLLAGLSAGGFGTVNIGLKHPQLFAAAAALSPAIWDPVPAANSGARKYKQFEVDGAFSEAYWKEQNWPSHLEAYKAAKTVLPFFIMSGDHDNLDIAVEAAKFYQALRATQPDDVELRVVNGDHEWKVWQAGISEALPYMMQYATYPRALTD